MYEQATISRTEVNDNVPNFDDLLEEVLNWSFGMSLPVTFKKIINTNPADNPKQASAWDNGEKNGGGKKKRKRENGNGNLVRKMSQDNDFKVTASKTWITVFRKQFLQDCPT
jgi:hypothetical protein